MISSDTIKKWIDQKLEEREDFLQHFYNSEYESNIYNESWENDEEREEVLIEISELTLFIQQLKKQLKETLVIEENIDYDQKLRHTRKEVA